MSDKPFDWTALRELPNGSKVEVYIRGTGLWAGAVAKHWSATTVITPESQELLDHRLIVLHSWSLEQKEAATRLVRLPRKPGHRVEPGAYRQLLAQVGKGLVGLMQEAAEQDGAAASYNAHSLRQTVKYLLGPGGGFARDLWSVFRDVLKEEYKPEQDDVLYAILKDLEKDKT